MVEQSTVARTAPLCAHTSPAGEVWAYRAGAMGAPAGTGRDPAAFAAFAAGAVPPVRVLAVPGNAALIRLLGELQAADPEFRLEIGRPALRQDWAVVTHDPGGVLMAISPPPPPRPGDPARPRDGQPTNPARGGWRPFGAADRLAYAMAAAADDATAAALVRRHPAYPALSFLSPRDDAKLGRLVGEIVDPRFFVHGDDPDGGSRLRCFLGLITRSGPGGRRQRVRRGLAVAAWKGGEQPPPIESRRAHGAFLWRYWLSIPGDRAAADLVTTRRFAAFLAAAWIDATTPSYYRTPVPRQGMLIPEYAFPPRRDAFGNALGDDGEAIAAFHAHMRAAGR